MAKILVIDDEADLLEMMRLVLGQRGGHEVILSAEGREGLAKALADPPDLAIIDVMMPGITGYDICRQLRANPATASLPILIITARGQPMDREAALEAGADDHMVKPVVMVELLERIDSLLAEKAGLTLAPKIVALMSLRGGVGVTTLAVNLAATWTRSERSVCLVDFCPSSGHVALQLGLRPQPSWTDIVQAAGDGPLDVGVVQARLLEHSSGLRVLASPFVPPVGLGLPLQVAQAVLGVLRQRFSVVVVDTPSLLDDVTLMTLETAFAIGLVFTPESPSLQTTVGTLRALSRWSDKFYPILNQVVPGSQPPLESVERTLKRPLVGAISFDPSQARAVARGNPLAFSKLDAPLAQGAQILAQKLGVGD